MPETAAPAASVQPTVPVVLGWASLGHARKGHCYERTDAANPDAVASLCRASAPRPSRLTWGEPKEKCARCRALLARRVGEGASR